MAGPRKPESDRLTEAEVLAPLGQRRHAQSLREIAEALDLTHAGRRDLRKIIEHLAHAGAVEKTGGDHYRLRRDVVATQGGESARASALQRGAFTEGAQRPAGVARPAERATADPNRVI